MIIYHISGRVSANDDRQTNSVSLTSWRWFLSGSVCQRGGENMASDAILYFPFFLQPLFFWKCIVGFELICSDIRTV